MSRMPREFQIAAAEWRAENAGRLPSEWRSCDACLGWGTWPDRYGARRCRVCFGAGRLRGEAAARQERVRAQLARR